MNALGRHILVEFFRCEPNIMNDVVTIETAMVDAAEKSGATVINSNFHHFSPYGVSGVVIIQESHLAIHTWPEYQYAAVDLFTCGDTVDPWIAFDHLKEVFQAQNYSVLELHRGSLNLLERIPFNAENFRKAAEDRIKNNGFHRNMWLTDKDENIAVSLRAEGKVLFDKTGEFQRVRVYDAHGFGRTLMIDNMFMTTERDEAHYHEMIVHPAMFAHGNVKKALVIGGGDGGTIREVLRHKGVEEVVMVEIDENVVNASKEFMPKLSCQFDNEKLNLIIGDGIKYVAEAADESFDLIIVDGSDPVGPAEGLFTEDFYSDCRRVLKSNGVLVAQGESPVFNQQVFIDLNKCLKAVFEEKKVNVSVYHIPTYPSGVWTFQTALKGDTDLTAVNRKEIAAFVEEHDLIYYNYGVHLASYMLPNFIKKLVD